jgi:hypothetical protein
VRKFDLPHHTLLVGLEARSLKLRDCADADVNRSRFARKAGDRVAGTTSTTIRAGGGLYRAPSPAGPIASQSWSAGAYETPTISPSLDRSRTTV